MALVTTLFALAAGEMLARAALLQACGQTVEAEVTRTARVRRGRRSGNSPYLVEYRFRPLGSERWYTRTDVLTWAESPAGLRGDVWERARDTGRIPVTYVPAVPAVNRPAEHTPLDGLLCTSLAAAFLGVMALAMWAIFKGEVRKWRAAARPRALYSPAPAAAPRARHVALNRAAAQLPRVPGGSRP